MGANANTAHLYPTSKDVLIANQKPMSETQVIKATKVTKRPRFIPNTTNDHNDQHLTVFFHERPRSSNLLPYKLNL